MYYNALQGQILEIRGQRCRKGGMEMIRKVRQYYLYFMMYSVIGWLYEVFLEVVVYRWGFSNRGVLYGPYCLIYGVGAVVLLFTLRGLQRRKRYLGRLYLTPFLVFCGIVILCTLIELAGSYIMEWSVGGWDWNYERFAFDFQGRIAPNPSLRFGAGGMVFLYGLQPCFEKLTAGMTDRTLTYTSTAVLLLFLVDAACSLL